jgi:hypothetical protein
MKLILKDAAGILKFFLGAIASYLILFGIHWMAILTGVVIGILYLAIPKKYLY